MLILGVKMTDPTSSFIFALIVSGCGVQGTAISSRTGNVTAIVGYPLTLSWTHSFLDSDIDLCYYQSKKRYLDEFLGWSNKNRERLNITDNHHGWDFINKKMPCQDGIRREDTEICNAGQYKIYMQTTDGQRHEGQWINVTIVSGSELYYTLTINETEVTENIAHQSALPTLQIEDHGLTKFSISLGKDFPDSNITLSAHFVNSSNVETLQTCPMSVSCSGNFTAKTDLVQISANIESGIQGFELVRIQQPVIVIDQSPITAAMVVYPMVGLIVAVVFLVVFLLMLIILLICLCNKRARHLKKVRKYLLRKHVSAKRVDLQLSATFPVKPHAEVEWFRDREKLKDGTGTGVKVWNENNTYSIRIKADHVKPGMYHFHALDQWDEPISHHARVTIGGSKEADKTTGNSKPEFKDTTYLKDKRFRRGDPLNLSVSVSGFPPPVVNWYRDNQLLTQSPGHIDINQSEGTAMLTVTPSSNSDSLAGEYYCKAVNNSGHVQSQTIRVQVEPDNGDEAQEVYENVTNWNKPIPQVSAGQGMTATAKFSYQAANDDELSFDKGDKITNIEKIEEGWWKGDCNGFIGLFPVNYVELPK